MNQFSNKDQGKKKFLKISKSSDLFPLKEIKKNKTTSKNNLSNSYKEKIINQAIKSHSQGNIKEAAKYYQYFINQGFKDVRIFSNYAVLLQHFGKLKEAEFLTRKAIKIRPDYAIAHSNLGNILKDSGKLQEAKLSYRKAIKIKPDFAEAHYNLGNISNDIGELQEAELSYRKAIEIKPNFADAHYNLGKILKESGKLQEAELSYQKTIKIRPDYAMAHSNLGNILKDSGKLQEAKLSYRKAIKIKPDFAEAHYNLGIILCDFGELHKAELSTRRAIEIKPDYANALNSLSNILRDLGKLEELVLLSKSIIASKIINKGCKLNASLQITIANLLKGDYAETFLHLSKTKEFLKQNYIENITEKKIIKHSSTYYNFINLLYPLLDKENKQSYSKEIPHFGESHCLSFAHQYLSISAQIIKIKPVLITGGKAWHFAKKTNNQWKDSLTQQMQNHPYSNEVFISFGEIDCRKDEGILDYAIKNNKNISEVCAKTIRGYLNYMDLTLLPHYSKKYYFGVPAPKREKELLDELDIKRIEMIKIYNSLLKQGVLSRGYYFLDVYKLTSDKNGENNNIHMCDKVHLSPKCLSLLFENYLYKI